MRCLPNLPPPTYPAPSAPSHELHTPPPSQLMMDSTGALRQETRGRLPCLGSLVILIFLLPCPPERFPAQDGQGNTKRGPSSGQATAYPKPPKGWKWSAGPAEGWTRRPRGASPELEEGGVVGSPFIGHRARWSIPHTMGRFFSLGLIHHLALIP